MRRALAIAVLALAGCATPTTGPQRATAGPYPTPQQAEAAIRRVLAVSLKDPDSLKQFEVDGGGREITWFQGYLNGGGHESAWLWCFSYNAKNSYGAYPGVVRDGLALRVVEGTAVSVQFNPIIVTPAARC